VPEHTSDDDDKSKLTLAGCVVPLLTVGVIFGVAIPVVMWRDPVTGRHLSRSIAILGPFLIGAAFFGIVSGLLRLVRIRLWAKPPDEKSEDHESGDDEGSHG
jgi:hypothetical protein